MAGTVTFVHYLPQPSVGRIVATCTADAAAATYPATALPAFEGSLLTLQTNPGATAPQANYDIVLNDADGIDRLQGVGMNRHTANSEAAPIVYTGTTIRPVVQRDESLSLAISGNNVNSAVTVVTIYYTAAAG